MKRLLIATAMLSATVSLSTQAADVGVSISVGQPGFFGRIDIGDYPYPQPRLIYQQPRIIERSHIRQAPIYLHVPARHSQNWARYCREYGACGQSVYFVQNSWYERDYAPQYQQHHQSRKDDRHDSRAGDRPGDRRGQQGGGKNHGRGHDK